jgi:glycogen phosphorylase
MNILVLNSGSSTLKFQLIATDFDRIGGGRDERLCRGQIAQVADSRGWYNPHWHYEHEPETRRALDTIFSDHFNRYEPGVFEPLRETLLTGGDHYMHLADLRSHLEAGQRLCELYANPHAWARKAILNIANSGKFSSDRTIKEYATNIWKVEVCPVP